MQSPDQINSSSRGIEKFVDHLTPLSISPLSSEVGQPSVQVRFNCQNCGHSVRNHFAENSPIRKRCLEKGCMCSWAWDGKNGTRES
jgi:hypothetical protein